MLVDRNCQKPFFCTAENFIEHFLRNGYYQAKVSNFNVTSSVKVYYNDNVGLAPLWEGFQKIYAQ